MEQQFADLALNLNFSSMFLHKCSFISVCVATVRSLTMSQISLRRSSIFYQQVKIAFVSIGVIGLLNS